MSDLVNVYSPAGELFEASPVNARDLVVHVGWTYDKPDSYKEAVKTVEPVIEIPEPVVAVEPTVVTEEPTVEDEVKTDEVAEEVNEVEEVVESEAKEEVKSSGRGRPKK